MYLFISLIRMILAQQHLTLNQQVQVSFNGTQYNSIIVKFTLSNMDMNIVECAASSRPIDSTATFDNQSIQAHSSYQLVQLNFVSNVYLLCTSITNKAVVTFQAFPSTSLYNSYCVNNCNGYSYPGTSISQCVSNQCTCFNGNFGLFCQFQSSYLINGVSQVVSISAYGWQYFSYLVQNGTIILSVSNINSINYDIVYRTNPQTNIPDEGNLDQINQSADITSQLATLYNINQPTSNIIVPTVYIGLYNKQPKQVVFNLQLTLNSSSTGSDTNNNKTIIIITGSVVGALLLISFLFSYYKSRMIERTEQTEVQEVPQVRYKPHLPGFSRSFICRYFSKHKYENLIQYYPGLSQFDECTICLETLKNSDCCVSLCFHVFHYKCMEMWLIKQKTCPFCRYKFDRREILQKHPWIKFNRPEERQQDDNSGYLQGMQQKSDNTIIDPNQIQMNESNEELIRRSELRIQ